MSDFACMPEAMSVAVRGSARDVLSHLCEGECHAFGEVTSWCESRGDCTHLVSCPGCGERWIVDDDDLIALERWTASTDGGFSCGVKIA